MKKTITIVITILIVSFIFLNKEAIASEELTTYTHKSVQLENKNIKESQIDNETSDLIKEQYNVSNADDLINNLPNGVQKTLDQSGISSPAPEDMQNFSLWGFIKGILKTVTDYAKTPLKIFFGSLSILLLLALFDAFKNKNNTGMSGVLGIVSSLAIAGILIAPIVGCVKYATETMHAFADFMLCFIPVFTGVIASSGAPASAIGYNTAVFALAQIISSITTDILLPFIGVFLALSVVGSINDKFKIVGLTSVVKKTVIIVLSLSTTIFLGLFTMQSIVTASTDNLGIKTAKFLSGSFVPVVGGALSDAFSSVMACLSVIKSSIGGFSILVCIVVFLPPILTTLFFLLTISLTSAASDFFKLQSINGVMSATKDALTILLAFLISISVIIIVTTALMLKLGSG